MTFEKTRTLINRTEDELLLCCSRVHSDSNNTSRIKSLLQGELDWRYLVNAASRHAIIPFLYRHLNAVGSAAVPQDVLETLRTLVHQNAIRNLLMTSELLKILSWLESNGIA